jgi:hypothetical protein
MTITAFVMLAVLSGVASPTPPMPEGTGLRASIASRDADFFELYFLGCDAKRLRPMLADDVEFYHDKGGFVFRNAEMMTADYMKSCTERAKPDAWRSRRELVASSLTVDPVPGYGAIETGEHLFYERRGNGPEKLVGRARFAVVWQWLDGVWKISRALSYAHAPAGPNP